MRFLFLMILCFIASACATPEPPQNASAVTRTQAYAAATTGQLWATQVATSDPLALLMVEAELGSRGAEFWAAMATYEELRAYFLACGKRLARRQLGRRGKIRLAQLLFADMPDEDRRAVIATPRSGGAGQQVIQPKRRQAEGPRR